MRLQFRNVITLTFVFGFFSIFGLVMYLESGGFQNTIADSQLANILIGAIIGAVSTIMAFLYKQSKADGED